LLGIGSGGVVIFVMDIQGHKAILEDLLGVGTGISCLAQIDEPLLVPHTFRREVGRGPGERRRLGYLRVTWHVGETMPSLGAFFWWPVASKVLKRFRKSFEKEETGRSV
jgi:hypothetical protein